MSLESAQASYDFSLPAYYFDKGEYTPQERLQAAFNLAAKAGQRHVDAVECEVSKPAGGDHEVTITLWPVRDETWKQAADALVAMAAELLKRS